MEETAINELISNMREALLIENVINRVEAFLDLIPENEILDLIKNNNTLKENQLNELNEILEQIRPLLSDYKYYLDAENSKLNNMQTYIY